MQAAADGGSPEPTVNAASHVAPRMLVLKLGQVDAYAASPDPEALRRLLVTSLHQSATVDRFWINGGAVGGRAFALLARFGSAPADEAVRQRILAAGHYVLDTGVQQLIVPVGLHREATREGHVLVELRGTPIRLLSADFFFFFF
jgi:hypothetical protein